MPRPERAGRRPEPERLTSRRRRQLPRPTRHGSGRHAHSRRRALHPSHSGRPRPRRRWWWLGRPESERPDEDGRRRAADRADAQAGESGGDHRRCRVAAWRSCGCGVDCGVGVGVATFSAFYGHAGDARHRT
jgi:hypothetical protein